MTKIKPRKIIEDVQTSTQTKDLRGTWGTPITSDNILHNYRESGGNAKVVLGTSPAKPLISGNPMQDVTSALPRTAEAREQDDTTPPVFTDHQGPVNPTTGPTDDTTQPKPEDGTEGPPKTKPAPTPDYPLSGMPADAPAAFPAITKPETEIGTEPPKADDKKVLGTTPVVGEQEGCADGYHKDEEGNCVPDEPLDERVKRIKAETREALALGANSQLRKDMEKLETIWTSKYAGIDKQLTKAEAYNKQQDKILKEQRETICKEQLRCEDLRVEIRDLKNQFADATSSTTKYSRLVEDLKIENADLNKKYHGALATNLELSKKLTRSNEEYLNLAKRLEDTEEKFKKTQIFAKKTLKLRV